MKKQTKNRKEKLANIDFSKSYNPVEAIKILKNNTFAKFDETLEIAINLKINTILSHSFFCDSSFFEKKFIHCFAIINVSLKRKNKFVYVLIHLKLALLLPINFSCANNAMAD